MSNIIYLRAGRNTKTIANMKSTLLLFMLFSFKAYGQDSTLLRRDRSLIDSNLRAQTINQLAQADYYSKSTQSGNTNWISIVSVLVAGIISFGSAAYFSIRALKNEKEKTIELQRKEFLTEARIAASEFVSKTAQGIHSISWILWIAKFTPHLFENKIINEHDLKMRSLYKEIVSAQIILAARNKKLYETTLEIVASLYQFDGNLGGMAAGLHDSTKRNQAIKEMGEMWEEVYEYLQNIPSLFSAKLENNL